MKNLLVPVLFFIIPGIANTAAAQKPAAIADEKPKATSPKFIEGIEIKPGEATAVYTESEVKGIKMQPVSLVDHSSASSTNIEKFTSLQFKYAQILNCNVESIQNITLYKFIDEWWETKYLYGGTTKSGVDCSAFTGLLLSTIFEIKLSRTARDQYNECSKLARNEINEGDLVFFNTRGGISHVGFYLGENYFVHASTNNGVTISSLDDPYYRSRFIGGGKIIQPKNDLAGKSIR